MNKFDEMRAAVGEAEYTIRAAESLVDKMASLIVGRLRKVDNEYTLVKLKKELEQFNARTRKWKS